MPNNDLRTLVIPFSVPVYRIPHWVLKVPHFEQHPGVMGTCHSKIAAACMVACEVESAPVLLSILEVSAALAIGLNLALETRLGTSVENLKADRSNAQSACYCLEVHPVKLCCVIRSSLQVLACSRQQAIASKTNPYHSH